MKNPLNKRLPREFRKDFGKYLVIFLLLVITIGFVSGFLVADGSMIKAYTEGIDNYNTENGHFRTSEKMNDAQIQSVEENGIRIYNNFYLEQDLTKWQHNAYLCKQGAGESCLPHGRRISKSGK